MSKTSNMLKMIRLMNNGRKYSVSELSELLEVTPRMVRKYKDELEMAGINIHTIRGRYGGYVCVDDFTVPQLTISNKELDTLKNYPFNSDIKNIIDKITSGLTSQNATFTNHLEETNYAIVSDAINSKLKLNITYLSAKGHLRERIIHPDALYKNGGVWFVIGYCEYKKDIRRFRLGSMKNLYLVQENF